MRWPGAAWCVGSPARRRPGLAARLGYKHLPQSVEVLHALARTERDRVERFVGDMDRHPGVLAQPLVQAAQEGAAASQSDAAVHHVARELRRALVERGPDRVDDHHERLGDRVPDLSGRDHDGLGQATDQVPAADLRAWLVVRRIGRAERHLDLLGGPLAERQRVLLLTEVDDRLIELVAAYPDRLSRHDAAQRDHGDLGRAAADVHDHIAGRLVDRQPSADGGSHRLLDDVHAPRARLMAGFLDGALLDSGDSAWHGADNSRLRQAAAPVDLLNEVAQHALRNVKVSDYAVFKRPDGDDIARSAANHALGFEADCDYLSSVGIECDDSWFIQNNSPPSYIH